MLTPPPGDSRPQQPPSDWDRLVARAQVEHARDSVAPPPPRPERGRRGLAAILVAGALWAALSAGLHALLQPPRPSEEDLDRGRRALLALINSSLEDHLRVHGEYPETLADVLPLQVEVSYHRAGKGYEASVRLSDGRQLVARKP